MLSVIKRLANWADGILIYIHVYIESAYSVYFYITSNQRHIIHS